MNEQHFTFRVNGSMRTMIASEWSDVLAKFPNAILEYQMSL